MTYALVVYSGSKPTITADTTLYGPYSEDTATEVAEQIRSFGSRVEIIPLAPWPTRDSIDT